MGLMNRTYRHARGRAAWVWRRISDRGQQAHILLSDGLVGAGASVGDAVGSLSINHGRGSYTLTLEEDAGGLFAIDGAVLEVADALSAGTQTIIVKADNGEDDPVYRTFIITVSA